MRLFTALALTDDVRVRLAAFVARLRREATACPRFVGIDQLHVTTKFLGERDGVEAVIAALGRVPRRGAVEGAGFFPDALRPRFVRASSALRPRFVRASTTTPTAAPWRRRA